MISGNLSHFFKDNSVCLQKFIKTNRKTVFVEVTFVLLKTTLETLLIHVLDELFYELAF